jgi:hypothetical protein
MLRFSQVSVVPATILYNRGGPGFLMHTVYRGSTVIGCILPTLDGTAFVGASVGPRETVDRYPSRVSALDAIRRVASEVSA